MQKFQNSYFVNEGRYSIVELLYARYLDTLVRFSNEMNKKGRSTGHSFGTISRFATTATFGRPQVSLTGVTSQCFSVWFVSSQKQLAIDKHG